MLVFFKKLAKNKKGSEVVEKIFMIVVSLAIAAVAATWITTTVNNAMKKGNDAAGDLGSTDDPSVTNPLDPSTPGA